MASLLAHRVSKINPRINRVWVVGKHSDYPKIASTEWIPFFGLEEIVPEYLRYYLTLYSVRDYLAANASGVGGSLMRINTRTLEDYPFPLAPLPEQHRIVSTLEEQFTRLDAAITSLQQDKARLKQARTSILKAAVDGTLTEAWRAIHPDVEPAEELLERILLERREKWEADLRAKGKDPVKAKYVEPVEPNMEELPELPQGWCWARLETLADIQLGKMLSPKAYEPNLTQLPYLRNENVRWGAINYSDVKMMGFKDYELEKYRLEPNDLLVCEGGEAGRCAVYTARSGQYTYQKALHRVRMIGSIVNPHFIQFCMQHYASAKIVIPKPSETTIQHLPLEKMQILPFPLPPLTEQQQIVAEVEARLSVIAQAETVVETSLKRAERTRQSILQKAFSGQLVPQDPDDEPASVLLERIRVEREKREQGRVNKKQKVRTANSLTIPEPGEIDVKETQQEELWEHTQR